MKTDRPTNIDLGTIRHYRFPITAITSILHRLSGVYLFILIPFMVWALDVSLYNPEGFAQVKHVLTHGFVSFLVWIFLSAISYHFFAGIRHLIMDIGFGEHLGVARTTSIIVLVLGILAAIFWGIWLW